MADAARQATDPTLAEPGNLAYGYCQNLETPTSFIRFERWKNAQAQQEHVALPHFQKLLPTFAAVGTAPRSVVVYAPIPET